MSYGNRKVDVNIFIFIWR